jgi:O-antigen/teichoic acid export membrane protein
MSDLTVVKNAFANLCRGGAVALSMLLLPPFLARILTKDTYGTWLLILQLSAYVSLLDLGIQTVIGRFVAHYNELGDIKKRDSIISSAIALLTGAAALAILGIGILAWQLPYLFKDMPANLQQDAQLALMCVGSSLAVALPFTTFGAVFLGLQRYDVPAWIVGSTKIFSGVLVVLVAQSTHSMVMMALVVAATNLAAAIWQYLAYKKMAVGYRIALKSISKKSLGEVIESCVAISISSLGMLIVSGLDTTIIGFFDYKSVSYYALAATLTSFVFGVCSTILNTIVPVASSVGARNEPEKLGELLISTTRYTLIVLIATNLPLLLLSKTVMTIWVGDDYATNTTHLFEWLIAANFVRQIGAPYFAIAIGCDEHRKILLSPLVEAFVNLVVSVSLTARIGAAGVAIGTLFGGFASVGMHFFYNLPRTKKILVSNKADLRIAIFKPILLVVVPTVIFYAFVKNYSLSISIPLSALAIFVDWIILWKYILRFEDRQLLSSALMKKFKKNSSTTQ